MIALFWLLLALSVSPFRSKNGLAAENAALRHQLIVLQRRVRGRVQLTNGDRLFLVTLYRWFPSVLRAITIVRPRDPRTLASSRLPSVLAVEIPLSWRPTEDRWGTARADPPDERRKSAMGCAAHPWRAAQARLRGRAIQRREVHGQAMWTAVSGVAHLPA
jgi:hypothetical protein